MSKLIVLCDRTDKKKRKEKKGQRVNSPCQKDKKMTDLIVRNLSTGSYGRRRSLVAKKKRKRA